MKNTKFNLKAFVATNLRRISTKSPVFGEVKKAAKVNIKMEYLEDSNFAMVTPLTDNDQETFIVEVSNKKKNALHKVMFRCAKCGKLFFEYEYLKTAKGKIRKTRMMAVDHIDPVIDPEKGFENWDIFISRLFVSIDRLQLLCNYPGERDGVISCHKEKTKEEKKIRDIRVYNKDVSTRPIPPFPKNSSSL
jgi:hypothetical protein